MHVPIKQEDALFSFLNLLKALQQSLENYTKTQQDIVALQSAIEQLGDVTTTQLTEALKLKLDKTAKAVDSELLDGHDSSYFTDNQIFETFKTESSQQLTTLQQDLVTKYALKNGNIDENFSVNDLSVGGGKFVWSTSQKLIQVKDGSLKVDRDLNVAGSVNTPVVSGKLVEADTVNGITLRENSVMLEEKYTLKTAFENLKTAFENLMNGSPETFNTLKEIADELEKDNLAYTTLKNLVDNKVNVATYNALENRVDEVEANKASKQELAYADTTLNTRCYNIEMKQLGVERMMTLNLGSLSTADIEIQCRGYVKTPHFPMSVFIQIKQPVNTNTIFGDVVFSGVGNTVKFNNTQIPVTINNKMYILNASGTHINISNMDGSVEEIQPCVINTTIWGTMT